MDIRDTLHGRLTLRILLYSASRTINDSGKREGCP